MPEPSPVDRANRARPKRAEKMIAVRARFVAIDFVRVC
jgi:hypothetical protein